MDTLGRKIQIYRGLESEMPTFLDGEIGYTYDENGQNKKLWIGTTQGVNQRIQAEQYIIDDLVSNDIDGALSARQGKVLKDLIDAIGNGGSSVNVIDNLLSNSPISALSARQGKVVNEKIVNHENNKNEEKHIKLLSEVPMDLSNTGVVFLRGGMTQDSPDSPSTDDVKQDIIDIKNELQNNLKDLKSNDKSTLVYSNALEESSFIPFESLDNTRRKISESKKIKIAFVGDSITAGADQISQSDTYVYNFTKKLSKLVYELESYNYAIPSTGISNVIDSNFKAGTNFNNHWAISGESWIDHIKDFNPDMLIVAFGMNDTGLKSDENYANYERLLEITRGWSNVPDLVIVPTILPTKNITLYNQSQDATLAISRSTRQFAIDNKIAIADANRLFRILRDGIDEITEISRLEKSFYSYPNNWKGDTDSFSLSGDTLTPIANSTGKFVLLEKEFYNGVINIEIKPTNTGIENAFWLNFRTNSELGRLTLLVVAGNSSNGYIEIYSDDSPTGIASKLNMDIKTDIFHQIKVDSSDNKHSIFINGIEALSFTTEKKMHNGFIEIGAQGSVPTLKNMQIIYKDKISFEPIFEEKDLLGENGISGSGNGINHPSAKGYYFAYEAAFKGLLTRLTNLPGYLNKGNSDSEILQGSIDFNLLTQSSIYQVGDISLATNAPLENWGVLEIINPNNAGFIIQRYYGVSTGKQYTRTSNGSDWTVWTQ